MENLISVENSKKYYTFLAFLFVLILGNWMCSVGDELPDTVCDLDLMFSIENNGCEAPCNICFKSNSINIQQVSWDFGNGIKLSDNNPRVEHRYSLPGTYNVGLTGVNENCESSITQLITVNYTTFDTTFSQFKRFGSGQSIENTIDGGYILAGLILDEEADMYTSFDGMIVKLNSNFKEEWKQKSGGSKDDRFYDVIQDDKGKFILTGYTESNTDNGRDLWIMKRRQNGEHEWSRRIGSERNNEGHAVILSNDGGYVIAGVTYGTSGGDGDVYVIKVSESLDTIWTKTFGSRESDNGRDIINTADNGYLVVGSTRVNGGLIDDIYAVKMNIDGEFEWETVYDNDSYDYANSVVQTPDGGYLIVGSTGDFQRCTQDLYLLKLNSEGNFQWDKTFGGIDCESGNEIKETADGNYILVGRTESFGFGGKDVYLLKVNSTGEIIDENTFGGRGDDIGHSVLQTEDSGYLILGSSRVNDKQGFFLVKTDDECNI